MEKSLYLRVRELERPDLKGTTHTQISYRSWFGEAFVNIERKYVKNNWIKVSEAHESEWKDCVLVTIYGLSKGSYRFLAWVNQADISERMEDDRNVRSADASANGDQA